MFQAVEYMPWAPARPFDGGVKFNCMLLKVGRLFLKAVNLKKILQIYLTICYSQVSLESSDTHRARISNFDIKDEKCGRAYCRFVYHLNHISIYNRIVASAKFPLLLSK